MRTAFFTGAGASRAIGYPLTKDLLPRVRLELKSGELFDDPSGDARDIRRRRKELHGYLMGLLPGFERLPSKKLPLITDVFSLVEYALVSGEALPVGGERELSRFRELLKQAIADILLGDFYADWTPAQKGQKDLLHRLTKWIHAQGDAIGLVSTNYDIGIEYELYELVGRDRVPEILDLGFDWREGDTGRERKRPARPGLRVFKLHGSLDQLRCPLCGYVYFNELGAIAGEAYRKKLDGDNTCVCGDHVRLDLHIVPPSLVRDVREANLLSVWRSALEWMRTADRWIIVGYSMPPEDLAMRSLLLRAYAGAARKPKITVVQRGEEVRSRYKLLFPDCRYESKGLEFFLSRLASNPRRAAR